MRIIKLFIFSFLFSSLFYASGAYAVIFTITDLGTLNGDNSTWGNIGATDINDNGEVVGYIATPGPSAEWHSFRWDEVNGMQDLGTLGGNSTAYGTNNQLQVVGLSGTDPVDRGADLHAFSWDNVHGIKKIDSLNDGTGWATAINNYDDIVGLNNYNGSQQAFILKSGQKMEGIGTLGGRSSIAWDINDKGQVVGYSGTSGAYFHAFVWDELNGISDLGSFGESSSASAINELGDVVGYANVKGKMTPVIWDNLSGITALGSLGGSLGIAHDINDLGQVVGSSRTSKNRGHAFLWDAESGMLDLNDLVIDGMGWELIDASAVNMYGQIVGTAMYYGENRAYLLTPVSVPEPPILVLFVMGFLGLYGRKGYKLACCNCN